MQGQTEETVRFWLIEPTLFLAPICAFCAVLLLRPRHLLIRQVVILSVLVVLGLFFNLSPWSWRSGIANTALGASAYLAGVTLTYLLIALIGVVWLRWLFRVVAAIPVLAGLTLGTVGILGLLFIIGDSTPTRVQWLTPHYAYEVRLAGGAYTSEDFTHVSIARYYRILPIKRTVWSKSFSDHQYNWDRNGPSVTADQYGRQATVRAEKTGGGIENDVVDLR